MRIEELLQDFGSAISGAEAVTALSEAALEERSLMSFEQGYAAGWEDSLAMQIEEKSRLSETMSQNLQDLSFTFAEALQQLQRTVVPVLQAAAGQLLPAIMGQAIGPLIRERMMEMVSRLGDLPVEIRVPPGMAPHVRPVVGHALEQRVNVVEHPGLTEGQATIAIANSECEIDMPASIRAISEAIAAYAADIETEAARG